MQFTKCVIIKNRKQLIILGNDELITSDENMVSSEVLHVNWIEQKELAQLRRWIIENYNSAD